MLNEENTTMFEKMMKSMFIGILSGTKIAQTIEMTTNKLVISDDTHSYITDYEIPVKLTILILREDDSEVEDEEDTQRSSGDDGVHSEESKESPRTT